MPVAAAPSSTPPARGVSLTSASATPGWARCASSFGRSPRSCRSSARAWQGSSRAALSLLQLLPTLVLLVGVFALTEIHLSNTVPGANDNASGVATAVSLAAELDAEPPANLDVWVVLTGAEETVQEGMRAFVRSQRKQLDRESTFFLAIDSVGRGEVHFETAAGWAVSYAMDRRLIELASAIAESDGADGQPLARRTPAPRHRRRVDAPPALPASAPSPSPVAIRDGYVPDSHLPSDLPDAIETDALETSSSIHARARAPHRSRPRSPPRARPRCRRARAVTATRPDSEPLWRPSAQAIERSTLTQYMSWLEAEHGLSFGGSYEALRRWSIESLDELLGLDLGALRCPCVNALRARAREQ